MDWGELFPWLFGGGMVVGTILIMFLSFLCTFVPFAGIGWFLYSRWKKMDQMRKASQHWVRTWGTVLKSRVEVTGGDVTSVRPRVIYTYRVGARELQGDQIRAGEQFWSGRTSREAYDTVDRYAEGAEVTVFYNPANPAQSALER